MTLSGSLVSHWYFHIPNLLLAALMYTLIGRFLLSVIIDPDSQIAIWRVFLTVTGPFVKATRFITPRLVPLNLVVLFAAVWVLLARVTLFLALAAFGLKPGAGA